MLKAKAVDFFAHRSGIKDRTVAEREVVLTYVLRLLADTGRLDRLAFKGGTCIRKVHLGSTGRFSMDLDFTARTDMEPDDAILDLMEVFNREFHGIRFRLDRKWRVTQEGLSFTIEPGYRHEWNDAGGFDLQVSLRERPTLDVETKRILEQPYFKDLEFEPPSPPCLEIHEILAEKIRAAYQRAKIRDLYDLCAFAARRLDRPLLRRLVVIKLWQARDPFDPDRLLARFRTGPYDWRDLERLVRSGEKLDEKVLAERCVSAYSFLGELTEEERTLAADARAHRREELRNALADSCRAMKERAL